MKNNVFVVMVLTVMLSHHMTKGQQVKIEINENLQRNTTRLVSDFDLITQERKEKLEEIGDFLVKNQSDSTLFSALFVCTHNSRRSHIADVWFKFGLVYYGIRHFESYSGGVEATAFHPHAIAALERAGFTAAYNKKVKNAAVSITPGNFPVWHLKSKVYTHEVNPKSAFAAIMVCSDADKSCPVIKGASGRFSLPYDDPRYFDNTPSQDLKYDETVSQIGREMLYLTHYIKNQIIIKIENTQSY